MNNDFNVKELDFTNDEEIVYDLTELGVEGELVIIETEKYIETDEALFDLTECTIIEDAETKIVTFTNKDDDEIVFSQEYFKILNDIITNK